MAEQNRIITTIDRISVLVDRAAGAACAVMFGTMTLAVLTGVLFRYVFALPLSWPEEVSRYLMIWGASVAISLGIRADEHVGLTVIMDSLKSRPLRTVLHSLVFVLVLGFLLLMFRYSVGITRDAVFMNTQALGISMMLPYLAIPVSMAIAAVQLVLTFILRITRDEEPTRDMNVIDI